MKIKHIKPTVIAILVCFNCNKNPLHAQMHYLGISHQQSLNADLSATGIEYQNFSYMYNFGGGIALIQSPNEPGTKTYFNFDVNLLPFHHACLLNRLVPYVGVQYESISTQNNQEGFEKEHNYQVLYPKAGLKLSYDRFIGSFEYQFKQSNNCISARLMYTIFIKNRCVKKRIEEFNAIDFSQF
jgi:hypothetical protein